MYTGVPMNMPVRVNGTGSVSSTLRSKRARPKSRIFRRPIRPAHDVFPLSDGDASCPSRALREVAISRAVSITSVAEHRAHMRPISSRSVPFQRAPRTMEEIAVHLFEGEHGADARVGERGGGLRFSTQALHAVLLRASAAGAAPSTPPNGRDGSRSQNRPYPATAESRTQWCRCQSRRQARARCFSQDQEYAQSRAPERKQSGARVVVQDAETSARTC